MRYVLTLALLGFTSLEAQAGVLDYFRYPDGTTRWQYVANFSSSVLILTLLIVTIFLLLSNRRAARANRELTEIKATLEERVAQRTQSLNETTANLKDREQYITSIIESMPLMLIGLNSKMQINQWNSVAVASTGRPVSTVLGKNLWEAYPAITLTPEQVRQVMVNKQTTTIKHTQRDQYYFDITLYAVTDKGDTGIVILVDDITKQMKAENKVAERDKASAMGELASAMAYDINLPLQTIYSTLKVSEEKLQEQDANSIKPELIATLKNAQQSSKQASNIIQNLLDMSSHHQDEKELADVAQIMDQSVALADSLFTDLSGLSFHQINIDCRYAPDLPKIPCYALELQQVFVRALRNAFHSLNADAHINPTITIDISEFYDSLWIKIHHNGRILTPQEQEDIFQPFYSISDRPPACPVEQRLSYSYFIITDHHDGQMSVTSSKNFGTTFNIQLPLR